MGEQCDRGGQKEIAFLAFRCGRNSCHTVRMIFMRFRHVELFCRDTDVSKRFFSEGLGFDIEEEQQGGFVWLRSGGVEFLLRPGIHSDSSADSSQDAFQAIVLVTYNFEETCRRLASHGIPIRGQDGSPDCLTFSGPDGHWFQLIQEDA